MAFPCDFATSHMPSQTANEAAQTCPQHACKSKDERRQGRREHRQIAQPHTPSSIPAVPPRSSANGRPSARRQRLGKTPAPSSTTPILYYNTTHNDSLFRSPLKGPPLAHVVPTLPRHVMPGTHSWRSFGTHPKKPKLRVAALAAACLRTLCLVSILAGRCFLFHAPFDNAGYSLYA